MEKSMKFNPDDSKQAQEITFNGKNSKSFHPDIHFNNNPVNSASFHIYLGMIIDSKSKL